MSQGKYSPVVISRPEGYEFKFNAKGKLPEAWSVEIKAQGGVYDAETMFPDYDEDGFDSYGYSAYNADGEYVGLGDGVDADGNTEHDNMVMGHDEYYD